MLERVEHPGMSLGNYSGSKISRCLVTEIFINSLDIVDLLLSHEKRIPTLNKLSCLMGTIIMNKEKIFSHVLPKTLAQINEPIGEIKCTLLHLAVQQNRVKMVKQLIDSGGDVNDQDDRGMTPLVLAFVTALGCDKTGRCGGGVGCGGGSDQ